MCFWSRVFLGSWAAFAAPLRVSTWAALHVLGGKRRAPRSTRRARVRDQHAPPDAASPPNTPQPQPPNRRRRKRAVGSVKQDRVITGKEIRAGDVVLGMASSGVHSNGFSLVRKVLEVSGSALTDAAPWAPGRTLGDALLEPTVIYVKRVLALHDQVRRAASGWSLEGARDAGRERGRVATALVWFGWGEGEGEGRQGGREGS